MTRRIVALLRGINVGGRNRLTMASLRAAAEHAGLSDPRTHIQSGNLVADAPEALGSGAQIAEVLRTSIEQVCGLPVPVVVVEAERFGAVAGSVPFRRVDDDRFAHAAFYPAPIDAGAQERIRALTRLADLEEVALDGEVLWLLTPGGLSTSGLAPKLMGVPLLDGSLPTARNLRTLRAVAEIAARP